MNEILPFIFRKEAVTVLLVLNAAMVDRFFPALAFNTRKLLEENPIAAAVVLAAFILGIALA
jgi:hypothetical protein